MPKNTEAIRLAEASDWKGLQRLIEMAPEYAQEMGEYGMLPIHWACTESHVPVSLLQKLLLAYPEGARIKNDAELLPLHIAIRARVDSEWLERLIDVFPSAVHINAPDGVRVMDLAHQVGLHVDGLKILHRASEAFEPIHYDEDDSEDDRHDTAHAFHDPKTHGHPEQDHRVWQPLKRQSLLTKVSPLAGTELPPTFGRGSNSNNNTPVSPAHSILSSYTDDEQGIPHHRQHLPKHQHHHPITPPPEHLVSPSCSSSSNGSANTAPIPRTAPPMHKQVHSSFRKHSLDYHAHAAAAAAAARQHQEMVQHGRFHAESHDNNNSTTTINNSAHGPGSHRSMSMLGGRHQSLPVIPSFEYFKFNATYPQHHEELHDESSEDDDDNNHYYNLSASQRSSGGTKKRATTTPNGGRSFESPPEWKRDEECSICRATFGMFKHRHHCRNCGKSICSQHSADKKIMMEAKGFTTPQRVCVTCYAMITHKESRETSTSGGGSQSPLEGVLQGAKITGPVAAFHQQMQQQQHYQHPQPHPHPHPQLHNVRSTATSGFSGISSPGSAGRASARSSISVSLPIPGTGGGGGGAAAVASKDKMHDQWVVQAQMNELRHVVASQQNQIEQLTQNNMQLQQQILEQEELKAETMLLITQLMTRVSVLELNKNANEHDDADSLVGDNDD